MEIKDTVRSFKEIVDGKCDDIPEQAFYMQGGIDDVRARAEQMKKESGVKLSVATPRGALVDADVEEVTAPGELGELGILPGHVALMSALRPGVLSYKAKNHTGVVAVGRGFLQVAPVAEQGGEDRDRVLVLVDQALGAADVDRAAAEGDLQAADRDIAGWKRELDGAYQALLERRQWAQARLDAAARLAPH